MSSHEAGTPIAYTASVTPSKIAVLPHIWTINNYTSNRHARAIIGPEFGGEPTHETKFRLNVFPHGKNHDSKDYMSVTLTAFTNETCGIVAKLQVSILNADNTPMCTKETDPLRFTDWIDQGFEKFLKLDSLFELRDMCLPGDRLTLICKVFVLDEPSQLSAPSHFIQVARPDPYYASSEQPGRTMGSLRNADVPQCRRMNGTCETKLGNLAASSKSTAVPRSEPQNAVKGKSAQETDENYSEKSLRKIARTYEKFARAADELVNVLAEERMPQFLTFFYMLRHMDATLSPRLARFKTSKQHHYENRSTPTTDGETADVSEAFTRMELLDPPVSSPPVQIYAFNTKFTSLREIDEALRKLHPGPTSAAGANFSGTGTSASQAHSSPANIAPQVRDLESYRVDPYPSEHLGTRIRITQFRPELIQDNVSSYERYAHGIARSAAGNKEPGTERANDLD